MARPPKGKPLTLRPIRLDDDVWAECQRLGKAHGTINEGLRARLFIRELRLGIEVDKPFPPEVPDMPVVTRDVSRVPKLTKTFKRGPRPKGDKQR